MQETNKRYPEYGSDALALCQLAVENPAWDQLLHPRLPYRESQVIWAVRREMARNIEDVLARRTRALLLDARASLIAAPRVTELMAAELGRDKIWCKEQVESYKRLAQNYVVN